MAWFFRIIGDGIWCRFSCRDFRKKNTFETGETGWHHCGAALCTRHWSGGERQCFGSIANEKRHLHRLRESEIKTNNIEKIDKRHLRHFVGGAIEMDFPKQTARFFCLFLVALLSPAPPPFFSGKKGAFFRLQSSSQAAIKIDRAAERCVDCLLELIKTKALLAENFGVKKNSTWKDYRVYVVTALGFSVCNCGFRDVR